MSMRYQVRVRNPENPHVFALRMNACRGGSLDPNTGENRREGPPSTNRGRVLDVRQVPHSIRVIERG